jgi:TPR repeat protein
MNLTVYLLGEAKVKKWILFIATILLLCSSVARANSLEEVVEAYNKGNYIQVLELLHPLAAQGSADAQYQLGFIYHMGKGVDQDYQEAAKWYRLAAEQGHAVAQNNLGVLYVNGKGVTQDYVRARMWFDFAARLGDEI